MRKWWHSLPENRQDRLASLGPLLSVLVFGLAVLAAMGYLRLQEVAVLRQSLQHDSEYAHQFFGARLNRQRETLLQAAQHLAQTSDTDARTFNAVAHKAGAGLPELTDLLWLDASGHIRASHPQRADVPLLGQHAAPALSAAESVLWTRVRQDGRPAYGVMQSAPDVFSDPVLGLMVPIRTAQGSDHGMLYARYNLPSVLYHGIPADVYPRYAVSLVETTNGAEGMAMHHQEGLHVLDWLLPDKISYTLPLPAEGLALSLQARHASVGLHNNMLLLLVLLMGLFTGWMLIANWRHFRRRQRAQQVLQAETSFRRAMENALHTGMRALDLEGRIMHVNASFCHMTGLTEAELVGQAPPFSFWLPEDVQRNMQILQHAFKNFSPRGGYEVRVQHRDGSVFDMRMYMTQLIGADGSHTGWMTSMADITEPKRIRRELLASQERFARVLNAIDTAVSVTPLGGSELLFANRFYRQWFGDDNVQAHMHMLEQAASQPLERAPHDDALPGSFHNSAEIHLEEAQRWVEVRSRYLEWTDGRLAQLVIATDITARRLAEERSIQHEQRALAASRLVTMGEMASSVAHELNQPLTAIHNYCNGMRDRVTRGTLKPQELLWALEKTAMQAQRAGQIIQRIREFVKRSAPNYMWANVRHMVENAVDLAEIEMRRRQVRLSSHVADDVREVMVDHILIEQVLINLLKNAAEAIDNADMPVARREVRLDVHNARVEGKEVVRFVLCDRGKGLSEEVLDHLFEAFFTTKGEGLGIGLNLCRTIVESHQGRLHAENLYNASNSEEVVGCCFSFWLPLQPVAPEE